MVPEMLAKFLHSSKELAGAHALPLHFLSQDLICHQLNFHWSWEVVSQELWVPREESEGSVVWEDHLTLLLYLLMSFGKQLQYQPLHGANAETSSDSLGMCQGSLSVQDRPFHSQKTSNAKWSLISCFLQVSYTKASTRLAETALFQAISWPSVLFLLE